MKKFIIAMAAVAAAFTMVSCEKEQLIGPDGSVDAGDCIITAFTESSLTKTSLSGNDYYGYDVVWSEGDEITIGGSTFVLTEGAGTTTGKFRGTLPKDGTYTAYYPSTYDDSTWPNEQKFAKNNITGSPMTAEVAISDGKVTEPLSFKNAGGILRLTVKSLTGYVLKSIKVNADGLNEITLDCGRTVREDESDIVFHIAVPEGNYSGASIYIGSENAGYCIKELKSDKLLVIERSKITPVSLNVSFPSRDSTDPLPGEFTVAEGRQVHFSKSNLRYYVENPHYRGKWCFFNNQYEYSSLLDEWETEISLFTWGYNAEKSIIPDGKTSDNVSITSGNLSLDQDWGSQIGNGESWRTLTSEEWQYLFKTRKNASEKYGLATVGGVKGIIILPDAFTDPMKNDGRGAFKPYKTREWTENVYTSGGNWEAMEHAGAVFLPVAGYRNGNETLDSNFGYYWSSSAYNENYANIMGFGAGNHIFQHYNRSYGCSVRLVTNGLFTVSFDLNGRTGTAPKSIENLLYGSVIPRPANVFVTGELVVGWYKDKECTVQWDFDTDKVREDITLYAKWAQMVEGKFTVDDKGKKVCFSRSNLWADGSDALHFEDSPWGFNGTYDRNHVSHFTWSSTLSAAAGKGNSGDYLFCSKSHMVSVDGSDKLFYALSIEEWKYLLEKRAMYYVPFRYTTNITCGNQKGLVIYADDYRGDRLLTGTDYEGNIPSNCAFLPGAGYRDGDTVYQIGDSAGFYWSSSVSLTPTEAGIDYEPYSMNISGYWDIDISDVGDPHNGFSIRLVANVD